MSNISISIDATAAFKAAERLGKLGPEVFARVRQRAVSTLNRRIAVQAARAIGEQVTLKRSDIRNRIRSSIGELNGGRTQFVEIAGSARRLPLSMYAGRWAGPKSEGATAQVFRDQPRKTYKSAFISPRSGLIVERAFKGGGGYAPSKKRYGRFPVRVLRGPSVGGLLLAPDVYQPLFARGREILVSEYSRLVDVELRK